MNRKNQADRADKQTRRLAGGPAAPGLLIFLTFLLAANAGCGRAPEAAAAVDYAPIIAEFRAEIPKLMEEQNVPGLSLAVVDDRDVLWIEGFGRTERGGATPVTPETLFSVQSISKNFTAAAVLAAVREGLVDLDAPITTYLPEFTVHSRFEDKPQEKMTLRRLLSHRAGFTHEAPVGSNFEPGAFGDHVRSISDTWLRFPVDQRYAYSNLGVDLAGWILQVKSGLPFHEYVRRTVLAPAGMTASTFDPARIAADGSRAIGHTRAPVPPPLEVPMAPAGALYSSAADMARWIRLHLNGGRAGRRAVIEPGLYRQMAEIAAPLPRQTHGYGLGLAIRPSHGLTLLNHGGGGFGFLANMSCYPEPKLGIVMLTNSAAHNFQNSLPNRILDRFLEAKIGPLPPDPAEKTEPALPAHEIAPDRLRPLAGRYLYLGGGWMVIQFTADRLGAGALDAPAPFTFVNEQDAWIYHGDTVFFYRFIRSAGDGPSHMVRMYDGNYLDYNDGPSDTPGPDVSGWDRYAGTYDYTSYGLPAGRVKVERKNGSLRLDYWKLTEHEPGLFFTPHGEALDFRGPAPMWRNIRLRKID